MERLIGAARESLTALKWVLILGLVANFSTPFLWWDWHPDRIEPRQAMRTLLVVCAIAALLLDSIPGGRIVNTVNRALAVFFIGGVWWVMSLRWVVENVSIGESELSDKVPLVIPLVAMLAGALAYVATARPAPDSSGRYGGMLYDDTRTRTLLHGKTVGRLMRAGQEYLTPLKWALGLGILACSLPGFYTLIQEDSAQSGWFVLMICIAIAAFILDSLPGGRIVGMTTRALAAIVAVGMFGVEVMIELPWDPYPKTFIVPFVVASVGAVFYVASARTAPELTSPPAANGQPVKRGKDTERLTRKARTCLTHLKWVLALSIPISFFPLSYWFRENEDWSIGYYLDLSIPGLTAALLLDSIPGGRITNLVTRAVAALCMVGTLGYLAFVDLPRYASVPYIPLVYAMIVVALVGTTFYVASARDTTGR